MYQQVLLNSRYKSFEEVKGNFPTWSVRYAELIRPTENPSVDLDIVEEEFEDETHPEDERLDEWMQASAMAPNFRALEETNLGWRDIDKIHIWSSGLLENPTIHEKIGFVNTLQQAIQDTHDSGSSTSLPALSRQQKVAHDLILDSLRSNSTICLIISSIIHHKLGITTDTSQSYKKLEAKRCRRMQYNMIGRKMLAYIDLQLRDIFGTKESFGNISILISLTLSLNNVFALNKFSGSLELRSHIIEKLCRD
ncbi:hypothetical protein MKW92_037475 [Papaver armeniacum]|nr:hypothetical protein MKW92_037475 [Papaver armeniacum]